MTSLDQQILTVFFYQKKFDRRNYLKITIKKLSLETQLKESLVRAALRALELREWLEIFKKDNFIYCHLTKKGWKKMKKVKKAKKENDKKIKKSKNTKARLDKAVKNTKSKGIKTIIEKKVTKVRSKKALSREQGEKVYDFLCRIFNHYYDDLKIPFRQMVAKIMETYPELKETTVRVYMSHWKKETFDFE